MKLPENTYIPPEKLRNYLLLQRKRNDKSKWLGLAGYTLENWQMLETDLRHLILTKEAILIETTQFGQMYEIRSIFNGPNGKQIVAVTVWMIDNQTGDARFITMFPDKKGHVK